MNIRRLPPTPCISDKKFSKWLSKQGIAQMKYFLTKTVVLSSTLIEDHRYQSSCTRQCPTGVGHRSRRNGSQQNCKQFNRNHRTLGWQSPGRKPEGNAKSRKFTKYKHQMQQTTQCILVTEEAPLDAGGLTPGLHLCFPP